MKSLILVKTDVYGFDVRLHIIVMHCPSIAPSFSFNSIKLLYFW